MDSLDQAEHQRQQEMTTILAGIQARVMNMHTSHSSGICEDCGKLIPKRRLEVVPGATRCVQCQTAFEEEG